jgi:excisionase family DNA binding protein
MEGRVMARYQDPLTTAKVAALLGLKPVTVRAYIAQGLLVATKPGRDWQIEPEEVARFQRERRKPGRPTEKQDE